MVWLFEFIKWVLYRLPFLSVIFLFWFPLEIDVCVFFLWIKLFCWYVSRSFSKNWISFNDYCAPVNCSSFEWDNHLTILLSPDKFYIFRNRLPLNISSLILCCAAIFIMSLTNMITLLHAFHNFLWVTDCP